MSPKEQPQFLPMSRREMDELGIDQLDIILICGDAYVDHPSFGAALIGRVLWDAGHTVGIISQPDWKRPEDFTALGKPRLFFGISSGNVDSMVNNLTSNLKRRSQDVYSPGGKIRRPDRAVIVYANIIHSLFRHTPIVLGGIEASLRRFAHYDYWSDSVRQSILADAPADILVFGMGERPLLELSARSKDGEAITEIRDIPGTSIKMELGEWRSVTHEVYLSIPSFSEVSSNKGRYAEAFRLCYQEQDPITGRPVAQEHPKMAVIQNPPAMPLSPQELDHIYELPFSRESHPSYKEPVPALEPVKFSITSHRGCFGSCSFCALANHQGRIVQSRSIDSIVREATRLTALSGFKGIIQDVGGPTANMYGLQCARWKQGACRDKLCSALCPSLDAGHARQVEMLRRIRAIPGVRKVQISSGIRHDLALPDSSGYLQELCKYHVSGHLKIAPEHISKGVIDCMQKPPLEVLEIFSEKFEELSRKSGKDQYLLPYFMSGHPGCGIKDMIELAEYMRDHKIFTRQVQDFTPTPMTISTAMYYTGLHPFTKKAVHIPKGREKRIQRALLQYWDPKNYSLVLEGLKMAGRMDLVGEGQKCLIPSRPWPKKSRYHSRTGEKRSRVAKLD